MTEQLASDKIFKPEESFTSRVSLHQLRDTLVRAVKEYQNNDKWFDVTDPVITHNIMNTYADKINRQILDCVTSEPNTIMGIVSECKIPQTTAYSKIIGLIENEFLVTYDSTCKKNKVINRYAPTLRDVQINIKDNQLFGVKVKFSEYTGRQDKS